MPNKRIPDEEFAWIMERVQEGVRRKGLDLLLIPSTEADFANVRYLSDYWPIFESGGYWCPCKVHPPYSLALRVSPLPGIEAGSTEYTN